ncbi:nucleolar protein 8 [Danio aesculapii]|uniref:nucleolar protein 8 n=1 Tax=Danio aesculapii TaxID=1142201 RepID=UPI0024C0B35C|nr:nucleolar protein 8 [Danio aesculapii]
MKRLYIGGLSHTVTEKDLKDRFGKFGDVTDVEIITRKDDQGAPLKTFGYININITDAEFKRCVGILNKSTWKGGTLLIQLAKESFLHRLAEEREQQVEKIKTPKTAPQEKLVDSFKAAGVENFHMKAAVPGTEIPGHKDWVVSKFGRVLPVLNLKSKGKNKVFKYDPSKHCHNIKRLETADDFTSVSELTWEVEGGDDEISKKRRGEFPKQKTGPKRSKVDLSLFLSNGINAPASVNKNKIQQRDLPAIKTEKTVIKKSVCVFDSDVDSEDEIKMLVAQEHLRDSKPTSTVDDEDNLEVVGDDFVVKSNALWGGAEQSDVKSLLTSSKEDEEYDSADTDEILTKSKTPKLQDSPTKSNTNECSSGSDDGGDDESDDDLSVDSDYEAMMMGNCYRLDLSLADLEQLAKSAEGISDDEHVEEPEEPKTKSAPPKKTGNCPEDILASLLGDDTPEKESKKKKKSQGTAKSLPAFIGTKALFGDPGPILKRVCQSTDSESPKRLKQDPKLKKPIVSDDLSQLNSSNQSSQQKLSTIQVQSMTTKLENEVFKSEDNSSCQESTSSNEEERAKTKLKSNVASCKSNTLIKPKDTKPSSNDCSSEESEKNEKNAQVSNSQSSLTAQSARTLSQSELKTPNNLTTPIKPKQTNLSTFIGSESSSEESESSVEENITSKMSSATQLVKTIPKAKINASNTPIKPKQMNLLTSTSSESSSEESETSVEENITSKMSSAIQLVKTIPETKINTSNTPIKPKQASSSTSSDSSGDEQESSDEEEKSKPVESHSKVLHTMVVDAQKQQQDNQKRIAALEQRQKETEQQKKLIQGALSNVDAVKANKGKHIVFDSDEEDNNETANKPEQQPTSQKKSLFEDDSESDEDQTLKAKEDRAGGSKLFDSEDEDDAAEDERFQIKPQFEGKAGEKLMKLQARFGTDSRFQIDSRFLESDDEHEDQDTAAPGIYAEEELLEEKKKSLDILQGILNTSIQPQSTKKSKTFKDVSGLHYDPTREEHAAFETKIEEQKKESKAARRKKREEAEKLPEVSKEVYYDVSVDLKDVFGTAKENQEEKKETILWDKEAEDTEDGAPMEVSFTSNVESNKDSSGGFKFSFFGDDTIAENSAKTDEYKIETIKAAKFSWQVDPRFQDSSSDEEGVDEVEEDQSASVNAQEEPPMPSKKAFFFFHKDDERLKEGPGMFCRSGNLKDQREAWEEKRMSLREECRKKHRDARRRQRPSLKT